jgi:hypothetical protein
VNDGGRTGAVSGPHVTRAVGLATAAGTAQPLTCGRPRQTGRRSAMSGIRGVSRFVEASRRLCAASYLGGVGGAVGGRVAKKRCRTAPRYRRTDGRGCSWGRVERRYGGVAWRPPQKGCAGDLSAGQGEGLPRQQRLTSRPTRLHRRLGVASLVMIVATVLTTDCASGPQETVDTSQLKCYI